MLEQFNSKEICPYCFEQYYIKNTPFRCTSPPSRCTPEIDSIYTDKWEDNRPLAKVLSSTGMFKRSAICPDCKQYTHRRLCPECHMELPHTAGQLKNHIFAVIGAKEAGKSHYLAVLINQIKKQIGPSMDILLEPMNDKTTKRYRNDFYKPVYDDGDVIEATRSAYADKNVQHPLIYSLTVSKKNLFGKSKIVKSVILVFFDTAGEDLDDSDTMSVVNKYIYRSNGIILLIDPLQLPRVRTQLSTSTALPDSNTDTADILNRTTRLIEKGLHLKKNTQIKIPLAIAFSKFDAVLPLVDSQFQLHASANHEHGFDVDDFEAINGEMVALLDQWEGQEVIQHAKTRYPKHGFFGLSALGCNPQDTRKISWVRPQRVEDPLLWLLAENDIIKKVGLKNNKNYTKIIISLCFFIIILSSIYFFYYKNKSNLPTEIQYSVPIRYKNIPTLYKYVSNDGESKQSGFLSIKIYNRNEENIYFNYKERIFNKDSYKSGNGIINKLTGKISLDGYVEKIYLRKKNEDKWVILLNGYLIGIST